MPRGSRYSSEIFRNVLNDANAELGLAARKAGRAFRHRGIIGDERAVALQRFFSDRLPAAFGISTGEAMDFADRKSGQLDLIIYEKASAAPIEKGGVHLLLPCESLYVVIEVKSVLNRLEAGKALEAAKKVRVLRPFKKQFVSTRKDGEPADKESFRCLYILFAFNTNIAKKNWLKKEYQRLNELSVKKKIPLDLIDRLIVLDRGMFIPGDSVGKTQNGGRDIIFLEFFLHVMNFIRRESKGRPPVDWQVYSERTVKGWSRI